MQSEMITYYMIPSIWQRKRQDSGDSKNTSGCQRLGVRQIGWAHRIFSKIILHNGIMVDSCHFTLNKTIEHTTLKVNSNVNYRFRVNTMHHVGSSVVTNVPLQWQMFMMEESIPVWGQGVDEKSLQYPLSFAGNLKLL